MPTTASDAYRAAQRTATSPRELEAFLLFRSARQIEAVVRAWDAPDRAAQLDAALKYNTRLWAVFQASAEEADCPLPKQVRINVILLTRFINRRTLEVFAKPSAAALQPLIDINRQIAMGLSESPVPVAVAS